MTYFFFYNNLINDELLQKIDIKYEKINGYIYIKEQDNNLNIDIDDLDSFNNIILDGVIINFNLDLVEIVNKINNIEEIRIINKNKYCLKNIIGYNCENKKYSLYVIF
jgi:hypothetical protein